MNKNEEKILEYMSNEIDSKMEFNKIVDKIDCSKYAKKCSYKKRRYNIVFPSLALSLSIALMIIILPNIDNFSSSSSSSSLANSQSTSSSKLLAQEYNGFIKDTFESNIGNGPMYETAAALPPSPIIDNYFNTQMDLTPSSKPSDMLTPLPDNLIEFKYIYEVEYKNTLEESFICAYVEKDIANKIYEEKNSVPDAKCASALNIVDGSIVDWFYSLEYYDQNKIAWYQYNVESEIYSEIDQYICVGVYNIYERKIIREIFSNNQVNIIDYIYSPMNFENNNYEYLEFKNLLDIERLTWYASNEIINEKNKEYLFEEYYSLEFECEINIENNTITLQTYSVQKDSAINSNYSSALKDFYVSSNNAITQNNNPNKELGEISYITYDYKKYVEILQSLVNSSK